MLYSGETQEGGGDRTNCANCKYNDGTVYISLPPKYKCTITGEFHNAYGDCNVDLVPVVRCDDCKWWADVDGAMKKIGLGACCCGNKVMRLGFLTAKDWYCADGERKSNETD